MKRILSITLLVCCTMVCGAQVVLDNDWQHYWEEWVEMSGQETIPDDLVETVEALRENPHNINDTHSTRLLELPFVSEFQWEILKAIAVYDIFGASASESVAGMIELLDDPALSEQWEEITGHE